jgi:hypothetical protein
VLSGYEETSIAGLPFPPMKLYVRDNISLQQPDSLRSSHESQMRVRLSLSGDKHMTIKK